MSHRSDRVVHHRLALVIEGQCCTPFSEGVTGFQGFTKGINPLIGTGKIRQGGGTLNAGHAGREQCFGSGVEVMHRQRTIKEHDSGAEIFQQLLVERILLH